MRKDEKRRQEEKEINFQVSIKAPESFLHLNSGAFIKFLSEMSPTVNNRNRIFWFLIICLTAAYVFIFIKICLCRYSNFFYNDWDLATYNQIMRGLVNGNTYSSLMGVPFLGNHLELTLILLAPIYALFASPKTLLIFQSIMLGLGAIPLFLIARRLLSDSWGLIFAVIYLFYPAVGHTNLNEFHPESFLPFIQFFLFYFFITNDFKKFTIFLYLCLFSKENMALIIIMLGLYALVKKREKKWFLLPVLSGAAWFWLYLNIFSPRLGQNKINYYVFYPHLGGNLALILLKLLIHPIQALKFMLMPHKLEYYLFLFGPLSLLSFFSPLFLLIALPNFLQHFLSLRATETSFYYYYPAEILAIIFISAVFGLKFLLKQVVFKEREKLLYILVPSVALFFNTMFGPQLYTPINIRNGCMKAGQAKEKNKLLEMIPPGCAVVSTFEFLARLSEITDKLYSFHRVMDKGYQGPARSGLPEADVEFALINFKDQITFSGFPEYYDRQKNFKEFFEKGCWGPLAAVDDIVLFKKNYKGGFNLFEPINAASVKKLKDITFDGSMKLLDYNLEKEILEKDEKIHLTFFWQVFKKTGKDYWIFISLLDEKDTIVAHRGHPISYRIYPTHEWKENEAIKEEYWMAMPITIKGGGYQLYLGLFDSSSGRVCAISQNISKEEGKPSIKLSDIQVK